MSALWEAIRQGTQIHMFVDVESIVVGKEGCLAEIDRRLCFLKYQPSDMNRSKCGKVNKLFMIHVDFEDRVKERVW